MCASSQYLDCIKYAAYSYVNFFEFVHMYISTIQDLECCILSISYRALIFLGNKTNSFLNFRREIEIVFSFEINQKFQRLLLAAGFNNEVDLGMDTKNETLFLP